MSKTQPNRKAHAPLEEREATLHEVKRISFSEIPDDLIDLSYTEEGNDKVFFVFPLLRWAKRSNMLFDGDIITFITIQQLMNSKKKGNYCLLDESDYPPAFNNKDGTPKKLTKGVKIIMQKHPKYGWQPKRTVPQQHKEEFQIE